MSAVRLVIEWAKLREARCKARPGDLHGSDRLRIALEDLNETELCAVVVTMLVGCGYAPDGAHETADSLDRDMRVRLLVGDEDLVSHLLLGLRKLRDGAQAGAAGSANREGLA